MKRARSYSFDDTMYPQSYSENEEDALELEIRTKIEERKGRKSKEGFIHVKEETWLGMCCGIFNSSWQKRYAKLCNEKLSIKIHSESPDVSAIYLKNSSVKITDLVGHNGKHNCLVITNSSREILVSLEDSDELKAWMLALSYSIETLEKQSNYFNF
ncbi:hypothetical protein SteCoe_38320 [Stentor coeruleus]|uniref:PH domain-containing protein n=1 Tax=Stentor coeruleus TaxID=5963 RepID=A0A1R2ALJ0_9CILI|nr:hypothetical protein SteCoe_38320 [Stentor coeruleus]